jgi:hypothetical protein
MNAVAAEIQPPAPRNGDRERHTGTTGHFGIVGSAE